MLYLYSIILVILIIGWIVHYCLAARREITLTVVSTLGSIVRQNLPLVEALQWAALSDSRCSRILIAIAQRASEGMALSNALKLGYRKCPEQVLGAIAAGEMVGQLPQAVLHLEQSLSEDARQAQSFRSAHLLYPAIVVFVSLLILSGAGVFVIPKFCEIYKDMGDSLPGPTLWLMDATQTLRVPLVIAPILAVVCLLLWLYSLARPRRPGRLLSDLGDAIKWRTPVLGWFEWCSSVGRVVQTLRLGLISGARLEVAIQAAMQLDINNVFRRRVSRWGELVQAGHDVADSARRCGMGSAVAWAFDSKLHAGSETPEVLQAIVDSYHTRYLHRRRMVNAIFWPIVIMLLATSVAFIVYAISLPLSGMMGATLETVMP